MSDQRRPSLSDPQVRSKLSQLKKLGLYNGNLRRKHPTKYGKSVLNKYMDVLEGKAHVVTIKGNKKTKGYKEARKEFGETQRVVRNKVIVGNAKPAEIARYSRKNKQITLTTRTKQGEKYTRRLIKKNIRSVAELPDLGPMDAYQIPFNRWGKTEFMSFRSKEDLQKVIMEYEGKYKGLIRNVDIVTFKSPSKRRKALDE